MDCAVVFTSNFWEFNWGKGQEEGCLRKSLAFGYRFQLLLQCCSRSLRCPFSSWLPFVGQSLTGKLSALCGCLYISGRNQCPLQTMFRPLKLLMHYKVMSCSPNNLSHELLCFYLVTDTEPGTQKFSNNRLITKWMDDQLLEEHVL